MNPRFYFSTCQTGAEKAVKAEVLAEYPQLRFAFSRPGFVTFKEDDNSKPALILRNGIFTRLWGEVLAQTREPTALQDLLARIPPNKVVQCFDRDQFIPGDEPASFVQHSRIAGILANQDSLKLNGVPKIGDEVFSLIWVDDFHVFLGHHIHSEQLSPCPGNIPDIPLPADSPSRAYLKIEEALYRFKPPIEKEWKALEVGCAPGGATTALLNRGFLVTGIDPQFMDAKIATRTGFTQVRKPARYVTDDDLRNINPDWLVMDMSITPQDALSELAHVLSILKNLYRKELKIRQGFLTIKLNDWKFASEIPQYLKRLEQMGFQDLHPVQLASNRQEFFVFAAGFRA